MFRSLLFALVAVTATSPSFAQCRKSTEPLRVARQETTEKKSEGFTLKGLLSFKEYRGAVPRVMKWSFDDRYVAYLWRPLERDMNDIWVYDTKEKKTWALTSIELMAEIDPDAAAALKYENSEEGKKKKKEEDEEEEDTEEGDGGEKKDEKKPPKYAGISGFNWANKSNEILFSYKGDLFRIDLRHKEPERLTETRGYESGMKFMKDDKGFYFMRDGGLYSMRFDGPVVKQLDPKLPNGARMVDYYLSPDETKIFVSASKKTKEGRKVSYIDYESRFATPKTVDRTVAGDSFTNDHYLFVHDLTARGTEDELKPWQIYHAPASENLQFASYGKNPWSPDSKRVTYATWDREEGKLTLEIADFETKKVEAVYSADQGIGNGTPPRVEPFFTPDGENLISLLEISGFRHAWFVDTKTKGVSQITKGDFEVYPLDISKDGKTLLVESSKEGPSCNDVYRVNISDGSFERLTAETANYYFMSPSHDLKRIAAVRSNWEKLAEMVVLGEEGEPEITKSHDDERFVELNKIEPELFSFKNRHGQTIYGYLYRPPNFKASDKRPLLIYVYGGPLSRTHEVRQGNLNEFNMYMAYKHGYMTCTIDPRGMSGYGKVFENANWESPGKAQVEDLSDGVNYLIAQGGIDKDKVGLYGWSFGGFQTQLCMYTAPDVFKLGIAGAGPTEWQNYNHWYTGNVIGKTEKDKDLDEFSLTKLVKGLDGPLMLIHGMKDTNVLYQDTVNVYKALLKAGKGPLIELVADPKGGHGLGGYINSVKQHEIYEAFLLKNWGSYSKK